MGVVGQNLSAYRRFRTMCPAKPIVNRLSADVQLSGDLGHRDIVFHTSPTQSHTKQPCVCLLV